MDVRGDVVTIDHQRGISWTPQCRVQYGAVLGDINMFTVEHCRGSCHDTLLLGEAKQRGYNIRGDALLAEINLEPSTGPA